MQETVAGRPDVGFDQISGDPGIRREQKRLDVLDDQLVGQAEFAA